MKIIFYKIFLNENPLECYIGSCKNFSKRKSQHKKNTTNKTKKSYWNNLYFFIRLKGGWENITMKIIYEINLNSISERNEYEQSFIDIIKPTLNSNNVIPNYPETTEIKNIVKNIIV